MKKKKQVLIQTTVPADLGTHARLRAQAEGISVAAWLRRLVMKDREFCRGMT